MNIADFYRNVNLKIYNNMNIIAFVNKINKSRKYSNEVLV